MKHALATPCLSKTLAQSTKHRYQDCIFQPDDPCNKWAAQTTEQLYVIL